MPAGWRSRESGHRSGGLVATIVYFATIRKQVEQARAVPDTAVERAYATELRPK